MTDSSVPTSSADAVDSLSGPLLGELVHHFVHDLVLALDVAGTVRYCNRAGQQFGWDPAALVGTNILDIVHPDDRGAAVEGIAQAAAKLTRQPLTLRMSAGEQRWRSVELTGSSRELEGEQLVIVIGRDVTAARRQQATAALHLTVADIASRASGVRPPAKRVLQETVDGLSLDWAALWVPSDPSASDLMCIASRGVDLASRVSTDADGALVGAFSNGEAVIVTDPQDHHHPQMPDATRTLMLVPMEMQRAPIGVLAVGTSRTGQFPASAAGLDALAPIAGALGRVVERNETARLRQLTADALRVANVEPTEQDLINELLPVISENLPAPAVAFHRYDPAATETGHLTLVGVHHDGRPQSQSLASAVQAQPCAFVEAAWLAGETQHSLIASDGQVVARTVHAEAIGSAMMVVVPSDDDEPYGLLTLLWAGRRRPAQGVTDSLEELAGHVGRSFDRHRHMLAVRRFSEQSRWVAKSTRAVLDTGAHDMQNIHSQLEPLAAIAEADGEFGDMGEVILGAVASAAQGLKRVAGRFSLLTRTSSAKRRSATFDVSGKELADWILTRVNHPEHIAVTHIDDVEVSGPIEDLAAAIAATADGLRALAIDVAVGVFAGVGSPTVTLCALRPLSPDRKDSLRQLLDRRDANAGVGFDMHIGIGSLRALGRDPTMLEPASGHGGHHCCLIVPVADVRRHG